MTQNAGLGIFRDGVLTVTTSSWRGFCDRAGALTCKRGFVWRGQTRDLPLRPSFDRDGVTRDRYNRLKELEQRLRINRVAIEKSYPNVLTMKEDLDAWAFCQHYGFQSPLLDWSNSIDIATFFAFAKKPEADGTDDYRYVYALNRSIERLLLKLKFGGVTLTKDRSVPFVDYLEYPNPRFIAQKGLFTKQISGKPIEDSVEAMSRKRPGEVYLVKFKIPTSFRDECLGDLRGRGIDNLSLLPDFQ